MRLECLRQFKKVVNGFYNKWINREGPILGRQHLVDPQTRNHPWLVWMIRKSRVSRKIRLKIRFPEIETRFAAKPSVGRIEKNFSFFFFFLRSQDSTFEEERFEDSTRTSFSNREFRKTFLLETNIEYQKISRRSFRILASRKRTWNAKYIWE